MKKNYTCYEKRQSNVLLAHFSRPNHTCTHVHTTLLSFRARGRPETSGGTHTHTRFAYLLPCHSQSVSPPENKRCSRAAPAPAQPPLWSRHTPILLLPTVVSSNRAFLPKDCQQVTPTHMLATDQHRPTQYTHSAACTRYQVCWSSMSVCHHPCRSLSAPVAAAAAPVAAA